MARMNDAVPRHAPLALSRGEALATILVGCASVDGALRDEEARRLADVLASSRWALDAGIGATEQLVERAWTLLADGGFAAMQSACAEVIPAEWRPTVFALAADLVLADGRLESREGALLDQLQSALSVDAGLARTIVDVLLIKNRLGGPPDV
jgi:hypothetical protein